MSPAHAKCSASQRTGELEDMRGMVDLLLELGGDLSRVNVVGNDIMAIAGEVANQSAGHMANAFLLVSCLC